MKTPSIRLLSLVVGMVAALAAFSAAPAVATEPSAKTEATTNITQTKATFHGTVDTAGYATFYGFEYGLTEESGGTGEGGSIEAGKAKPVAVSSSVEGLEPGRLYFVRLVAFANGKFIFGNYEVFWTLGAHIPSFEAEKYSATVQGKQESANSFTVLAGPSWSASCTTAQFSGSAAAPNSALSLNGEYKECTLPGLGVVTVAMNSCHYLLKVANAGPSYSGSNEIVCSNAKDQIEVTASGVCTLKIPAQVLSGTNAYSNKGEGSSRTVNAKVSASEVKYEKTGKYCFLVSGTGKDGTMGGTVLLSALNSESKADGFYIGGEAVAQSGVFMAGEKSETESKQPRFSAESYPQSLLTEQDPEGKVKVFAAGSIEATCREGTWNSSLSAATASLSVSPSYEDCQMFGLPADVYMTDCEYVLQAANAGPPYVGSTDISCDEGSAIGISTSLCSITIPGQDLGEGSTYTNRDSGSSRSIDVDVAASNVSYLKSGPGCFLLSGNGKDGSFSFGFRMYGLK